MTREYDPSDPLSIFRHSTRLLGRSLSAAVAHSESPGAENPELERQGKGGLGQLVEKFFFGYEPNSSPEPDFPEAGVELKVSPLKKKASGKLAIKERLVCDMIDYMTVVDEDFEASRFFRKSALMLILFYLHIAGCPRKDLEFIYSVLWKIKDKDLLIIRDDFIKIREKIRQGKAHELSEGDTMYLGACRKGQKGQAPRRQPFSNITAAARAFSLKTAYMRSILDFAQKSGGQPATNLDAQDLPGIELVTAKDLKNKSFDNIIKERFAPFMGLDYRQIADKIGVTINPAQKSKYATAVNNILLKGLTRPEDAEEIKKSGIKVKTIRLEKNGSVKEHISFETIDYQEIYDTEDWLDSRWHEIITTRYLFVIFREKPSESSGGERRYILDRMFFWTMPTSDYPLAQEYWENIRENVLADTLQNEDNTFWRLKDHRFFHVRPKAKDSSDTTISPLSRTEVPKKAYWFDNRYLKSEIKKAYGADWNHIFNND